MNLSPGAVPDPAPHTPDCRRDCCWTPFGHSAVARDCACHDTPIYDALAAAHGIDLDSEPPLHEEDA